jgi:tRNA pseudouridine synthase 10
LAKYDDKKINSYKKVESERIIQYNLYLCEYCSERNFKFVKKKIIKYNTLVKVIESKKKDCYICNNFFQKTIHSIQNDIINSNHFINNGQDKKIDIGTSLPLILFEKEDNLRALFKIKGLPNIKNQYNTLIRKEIIKKTGYIIDHLNPDIRIEIIIDREFNYEIRYKTKEIVLLGKYNKYQRGLSQRFKNNNINNDKQLDLENSCLNITIEDIILQFLYKQSGSNDIKIAWSGSEDKNSLVLGNGRPFIVKINSPQFRNIQKIFDIKDKLKLNFQEIHIDDMKIYYKYKIQIKTLIKIIGDKLEKVDLEKMISQLIGDIRFLINNKIIKKKIYSSSYKLIDNKNFEMNLVLDNGIPIKQLIGGKDFIEPCISNLINKKCECVFFDIDDVILINNKTGD